ncbi:MAG: nucleotidyltransferase domain-containing protein [Candidatus Micrarchaeota archaeon]
MLEPKYQVLGAFLFAPFAEKYAKEIEVETRVSHERALHYLDLLSKEGVLIKKPKGKQVFFSINRRNETVAKLLAVLEFERKAFFLSQTPIAPMIFELLKKLKSDFNGSVAFALLFGSAARNQAARSSDVDFLLATNGGGNIAKRLELEVKIFERGFNYAISPSVISLASLAKNWHKEPIYKSIWKDRVVLSGEERFWEFALSAGEII